MCTVWDQVHRKCALYGISYIESVHSMGSGTQCAVYGISYIESVHYGIRYIESVQSMGSGT